MTINETYEKLGIKIGKGEEAFWNFEHKDKEGILGLYKGKHCTGFPNISRSSIVKGDDSKADLIVPNNYFIKKYGITSFLRFNLKNNEQKKLLTDIIKTALENSNPDDLIMFFNVLRGKNVPGDKGRCMVMTVSYLHLWVIEKSRMYNTDKDFHKDVKRDIDPKLFSKKNLKQTKNSISEIISKFKNISLVNTSKPKCFAPIHIRIVGNGKNGLEKIVNSLIKTDEIIKEFDGNPSAKKLIDKGFRIMIRKDEEWSSNLLGGGRLSTISKTSD